MIATHQRQLQLFLSRKSFRHSASWSHRAAFVGSLYQSFAHLYLVSLQDSMTGVLSDLVQYKPCYRCMYIYLIFQTISTVRMWINCERASSLCFFSTMCRQEHLSLTYYVPSSACPCLTHSTFSHPTGIPRNTLHAIAHWNSYEHPIFTMVVLHKQDTFCCEQCYACENGYHRKEKGARMTGMSVNRYPVRYPLFCLSIHTNT